MKKIMFLVISLTFLSGCGLMRHGKDGVAGTPGAPGHDGSNCTVSQAVNGAIISCPDGTNVLVTNGVNGLPGANGTNGTNGTNGVDGHDGLPGLNGLNGTNGTNGTNGSNGADAIAQIIDPCGDNPGQFDEVLLKLSGGQLLAYFEQNGNRFLSIIPDGSYRTTDAQSCYFQVTNGVPTW